VAFLDATFYQESELPNRNMKEIPHPLVVETMELLSNPQLRKKIQFIHFNHSNPLLWDENERLKFVSTGFGLARTGVQY
jgi:pyrroloquinoline quinone biosynthesis protein B